MAKKIATVVVCVVLIAISVYIALPRSGRPTIDPADYRRPWVCDACGHKFLQPPTSGMLPCPKCAEKQGVQSIIYTCGKCRKDFEAYRLKDNYGADEDDGPPLTYFKKAGGEWTTDLRQLGPIACPHCGNEDPATLTEKRFGPKSGR